MIRFNIVTLILIVLAASFAFYWYEVRPMSIRTECAKVSKDIRFAKGKEMKADKDLSVARQLDEGMRNEYTFCLHSKGL